MASGTSHLRRFVILVAFACTVTTSPIRAQEAKTTETPRDARVLDPRELYEATPVTRAIERGLEFLRESQLPDGSWLSGYGEEGKNTGIVGLAVLAFLAAGGEPGRGPWGDSIDRALAFLLGSWNGGLLVRRRDASHGPLYEHGIAALVLGEVVGMADDRRPGFESLRRIHRSAVDVILRAQRVPKDRTSSGGWRYTPTSDQSDLSVTGWQILALRAAQDAGLDVPQKSIELAILYVKRCATPDGGFLYDPLQSRSPNPAMTGTGVLALELCGEFGSAEAQRGGDWILANPIGWETPFYYYSLYYTTQAMYQLGGARWERWRDANRRSLLGRQQQDGSWELPPNVHEREAGAAYTTAMATLTLAVEYRLLPIYQR